MQAASNDDSLVLRLTDNSVRFLLPGDIQKKAEEQLVTGRAPLAADVLKVPHHRSKTSSTEAFLAAVAPHFAVVSAGEANPFGHPASSRSTATHNGGSDCTAPTGTGLSERSPTAAAYRFRHTLRNFR